MNAPLVILIALAALIAIALLLARIWWDVQVGVFPGKNVQATASPPGRARSESTLAVNPRNTRNLVGASKRFFDLDRYLFDLVPILSLDGGQTWTESSLPMAAGWEGMTDPTAAFDAEGRVYLIGEPLLYRPASPNEKLVGLGMFAFRSLDGGRTWQQVAQLSSDKDDDKQWVVCDTHRSSPHFGNVYVFWGAGGHPLEFARSTDHGEHWRGVGQDPSPSRLTTQGAEAPDHSVSSDGTLHVFWHERNSGGGQINHLRSTDGGNSFEPVRRVADGLTPLAKPALEELHGWPHFDNATFRVRTFATSCSGEGGLVAVAWADIRERRPVVIGGQIVMVGQSRIYYRRSLDYGVTWKGPDSGQPLLNLGLDERHCFHPQLQATGNGNVGCAFYSFGPEGLGKHAIRVQMTVSWDDAATFPELATVTDQPWDPALHAPELDEAPGVTFIGEYFGLDTGADDFALLWTDTRTGYQELWSAVVETTRLVRRRFPLLLVRILFGVAQDGGGVVIVGGKLIRIPPRSPLTGELQKLAEKVGGRG